MRLISWNVNGLRACLGKGFLDFCAFADADIICLQETKMRPEQAQFELPGYRQLLEQRRQGGLLRHRRVHPAGAAVRHL